MGETGPCGPCSEVHYDRVGGRDASALVNADDPDVVEIWNLVFMQYNREEGGGLKPLPNKHIDTGMGLERLVSILQDKMSNYDTDCFGPILDAIHKETNAPRPYEGKLGEEDADQVDMAYRVVADHARTLAYAIADGARPSNEGRGYVLRRVLRRAVRYGQQIMGAPKGFFSQLVDKVVEVMGDAFPEICGRAGQVKEILADEERTFNRTLDNGIKKFNKFAAENRAAGGNAITGDQAFLLYATMGFPLDLTTLMAEEQKLEVDQAGFKAKMDEEIQKSHDAEKARKAAGLGDKEMLLAAEQTSWLANQGFAPTDSRSKYVWNSTPTATVQACFLGRGLGEGGVGFSDAVSPADEVVGLVLDSTSFYAEQGGQIFDTGVITGAAGAIMRVENVQVFGSYVLHIGVVEVGSFGNGAAVSCMVDYSRREHVATNHTMTHVLNYALRTVLMGRDGFQEQNGMAEQKGSALDENKLRFDFSWNSAVSVEQLAAVENISREQIKSGLEVFSYEAPLAQAQQISSVRAVFGESYPDPVRVISVGKDISALLADPANADWLDFSVEFCGGTHLSNTSEARDFIIIEERGTAKGIRRIMAVTHDAAAQATADADALEAEFVAAEAMAAGAELLAVKNALTDKTDAAYISAVRKAEFRNRINGIVDKLKAHKKAQEKAKMDEAIASVTAAAQVAAEAGTAVSVETIAVGLDKKICQKALKAMAKVHPTGIFVLFSTAEQAGRFGVYVQVPNGSDKSAKEMVTAVVAATGAKPKASGNATFANGLGSLDTLDAAVAAARNL
mmetsp:Transcript_27643/g.87636  ORF Transcript_27643/g.87636 Transcript_27643/m.87636 type:complete len:791 (-) Transcript_27643:118-2490(-)